MPLLLLRCLHSTWVTINAETRKLGKIPEDVKKKFLCLSPSPPRSPIPAEETRKKLPDFEWPAQVSTLQAAACKPHKISLGT